MNEFNTSGKTEAGLEYYLFSDNTIDIEDEIEFRCSHSTYLTKKDLQKMLKLIEDKEDEKWVLKYLQCFIAYS